MTGQMCLRIRVCVCVCVCVCVYVNTSLSVERRCMRMCFFYLWRCFVHAHAGRKVARGVRTDMCLLRPKQRVLLCCSLSHSHICAHAIMAFDKRDRRYCLQSLLPRLWLIGVSLSPMRHARTHAQSSTRSASLAQLRTRHTHALICSLALLRVSAVSLSIAHFDVLHARACARARAHTHTRTRLHGR